VDELQMIIKRWKEKGEKGETEELLNDFLQLIFAFVQNNFTGPFDKLSSCTEMLSNLQLDNCDPLEQLKASGEELNPNVKSAQLLLIAKQILDALIAAHPTSKVLSLEYPF